MMVAVPGLVPATQSASAATPTPQRATATATILTPATTVELHNRERKLGKVVEPASTFGTTTIVRYLDDEGRVTSSTNLRRHKIIIVDLP